MSDTLKVSRAHLIGPAALPADVAFEAMIAGKSPLDDEFMVEVTGELLREEFEAARTEDRLDAEAWGDPYVEKSDEEYAVAFADWIEVDPAVILALLTAVEA